MAKLTTAKKKAEPASDFGLPEKRKYPMPDARKVIAEGFGPASDYPFRPFATDNLTCKGKNLVEFITPAHHKGLGTMSWLLPSDKPITGLACSA